MPDRLEEIRRRYPPNTRLGDMEPADRDYMLRLLRQRPQPAPKTKPSRAGAFLFGYLFGGF